MFNNAVKSNNKNLPKIWGIFLLSLLTFDLSSLTFFLFNINYGIIIFIYYKMIMGQEEVPKKKEQIDS